MRSPGLPSRPHCERNARLLADLEARATAAGVAAEARRQADVETLAAIGSAVASQADQPAYCRLIATIINAGYYDVDQRADLRPALRRIFGQE